MKPLKVTGRILPISEATKRRNEDLFNPFKKTPDYAKDITVPFKDPWIDKINPSRMAGLPATQPEPNPVPALDQGKKTQGSRRKGVVLRITLMRCGSRLLDDDNLTACFKGLRDSISKTLHIDDADRRVRWCYAQAEVDRSATGTIVKFDLL